LNQCSKQSTTWWQEQQQLDTAWPQWLASKVPFPQSPPGHDQIHVPLDNLVLVLTSSPMDNSSSSLSSEIVGWVDLTQQSIQPDGNPSIFPTPLWGKQLFWMTTAFQHPPPRRAAWITNLLVAPQHRGQGWSKVLVAACEATARTYWRRDNHNDKDHMQSIHLHCHPDGGSTSTMSPNIPQSLYLRLGYQPGHLKDDDDRHQDASAVSSTSIYGSSSIYLIEGVPLLFMSKKL